MKSEKGYIAEIIAITLLVLIIIGIVAIAIWSVSVGYSNETVLEITVKEKYIKNNGESYKYMIVDTNNNAYQITDLIFKGKWNSTDIYNQLEIGNEYEIKTTGKRIPFFSMYPNINEIKKVEKD